MIRRSRGVGRTWCCITTFLPLSHDPKVCPEGQQEERGEEEELEAPEEGPLVLHHHYLPCLMPAPEPLRPWPALFSSLPPYPPHLQDTCRIQHRPPASWRRGV